MAEDINKKNIVFEDSTNKSSVTYTIEDKIGEGSDGIVFRVKDDKIDNIVYVLKICTDLEREESFRENATQLLKDRTLHHFVKVERVGDVISEDLRDTGEEAEKEKKFPAFIMGYGGSDILKCYGKLSSVSENVAMAFKYKVLLNTLDGLKEVHGKGGKCNFHGDLVNPRNILSGFDISTVVSKEDLEQKLIYSQVLLCDRTVKENLGTMHSIPSSLRGDDLEVVRYCTPNNLKKRTKQEIDRYAVVMLWSWLRDGENKNDEAADFFEEHFEKKFDEKRKLRLFPEVTEIIGALTQEIQKDGYFIIGEAKADNGENYKVVLRPFDMFQHIWAKDVLDSVDKFTAFYESHAYSFKHIDELTQKRQTPEMENEREAIKSFFGEILYRNVNAVYGVLRSKLTEYKKIEGDKKNLELNKAKQIKAKKTYEREEKSNIEEIRKKWTSLSQSLTEDASPDDYRKLQTLGSTLADYNKEIKKYDDSISGFDPEIEKQDELMKKNGIELERAALLYVKENCLGDVRGIDQTGIEYKTSIEEIITKI